MKHIVELSSEEHGYELFRYDSRREALAAIARLAEECSHAHRDGVVRRIGLVIGETPDTSEVEAKLSTFVCPKCGEDEINELNVCVVSHPVKQWNESGEPTSYGNPIVDWQSDYPYSVVSGDPTITFECANCMAQFERPKRNDLTQSREVRRRRPQSAARP
ncbi:MAG TPA: hypothetical protein VKV03_12735 [Candidatus Binataceae bacterium]|nr:hypothetical protein [Candidatus Binataceae bacterium]